MSKPLDMLRAIRDRRDLDAQEKAILFALVLRANEAGESWPSYATLADDAGVSIATAKRGVKSLEADGHLSVQRRPRHGSMESETNIYTVKVVSEGHHVVSDRHDVVSEGYQGGVQETRQVVSEGHDGGVRLIPNLPIELPNGTAQGRERPLALTLEPPATVPEGKKSGRAKKPLTPCPSSVAPASELEPWLRRWDIPLPSVHSQVADFLDHHTGKGNLKADWSATWRTWLRSPYGPQNARPSRGVQPTGPGGTSIWKVGEGAGQPALQPPWMPPKTMPVQS
jgi:DNA-binding transcriptional regulator YhcF (GntR family)